MFRLSEKLRYCRERHTIKIAHMPACQCTNTALLSRGGLQPWTQKPAVAGKGEVKNSYCSKDALVSAGLVLQLVHEQGNASALNLSVPLNWFIYAFFSISGLAFIVQYAEPWGCCHIRSTQTHDGCCHAIRARSRFLLPHQQPAPSDMLYVWRKGVRERG